MVLKTKYKRQRRTREGITEEGIGELVACHSYANYHKKGKGKQLIDEQEMLTTFKSPLLQ